MNTSFSSRRDIPKNALNNSNNISRELNSSFRLITSQGDLASSRHDDPEMSGYLMRNSSFKQSKFHLTRKISLKVDGKNFHENQFFFIQENKNSATRLYSPEKLKRETRLKTIRNSDTISKRGEAGEVRMQSRSLNNSGIHNPRQVKNFEEVGMRKYSQGKGGLQFGGEQRESPRVLTKSNRASIEKQDHLENSLQNNETPVKPEVDLRIIEKRNSLAFSDGADFEFSCVELNESKENNLDTESMKNIIDPLQIPMGMNADSMITFTNPSALENRSQALWRIDQDLHDKFKKSKAEEGKPTLLTEMGMENTFGYPDTGESWMKYPMQNYRKISEAMSIPRKISEIPMIDSSKRGSLIMYGGEMTPAHKRSEVIENNFGSKEKKDSGFKVESEKKKEDNLESKQNITDLMKMIIQKTQKLSTVEEANGNTNETLESMEKREEERKEKKIDIKDVVEGGEEGGESFEGNKSQENFYLDHFESNITNLPSIVNIESNANLQTIFDINFDPNNPLNDNFQTEKDNKSRDRKKEKKMKGSMLSDEQGIEKADVYQVVSRTDNDCESTDQLDSILLMPNNEIAKKRTKGEWERSHRTSEYEMESHMTLQSVISGLDDDADPHWRGPKEPSSVMDASRINFFKKPVNSVLPKEKFQEIMEAKSNSLKEKFRNSKLGLKISRMSRKAVRNEVFKMRSPTTLSITNHTDLSDPRHCSPKSQLKRSLRGSQHKKLKDKLWESLMSSKKNCSVDTGSKFDQTFGSVSIQSLPRRQNEKSAHLGTRAEGNRTIRRTKDENTMSGSKPTYLSGYLKKIQNGEVNLLEERKRGKRKKGVKENVSSSRLMRSSQHGSSSIYSKVSVQEIGNKKKKMKRSSTLQYDASELQKLEFNSVNFKESQLAETPLISQEISQRELDAGLLRERTKKEIESKFQNIYKPRNAKVGR